VSDNEHNNEMWRQVLTGEATDLVQMRRVFKLLPANPRCRLCHAPFKGVGGRFARLAFRRGPSRINPNYCNGCYDFLTGHPGGAEVEMTLLFADIRGSTTMAQQMGTGEYSQLIKRFYIAATAVFSETNAWIERLVGDQVIGLYFPLMAGPHHARAALRGAAQLLRAVGYGGPEEPWLPLGVGVHTGLTFMGMIGTEDGMQDFTVLGDTANTTARLSSVAAAGEALISDAACAHSGIDASGCEARSLQLKGRAEPIDVRVATVERLAALAG